MVAFWEGLVLLLVLRIQNLDTRYMASERVIIVRPEKINENVSFAVLKI